jgi:HEAT repeat protein
MAVLMEGLADKSYQARHTAMQALGEMGEEAKMAVPALLSLLEREGEFVRKDVLAALRNIDPEAAAQAENC